MDEFCDNWLVHKNPYDYADQDFRAWWQRDLTAMAIKNYNHPSVVMNSIGNEISELAMPEGQEYCKKLAVLARKLDPDKAVTMGVNLMLCSMSAKGGGIYGNKKNGKENKNGSQTMDNVPTSAFFNMLMNLAGGIIEKMAAKPAADDATKVSFSYLDIGGYNYAASRYEKDGTLHPDRVIVGSETLPKNLYHNWQLVKKLPYVIGDFMWTGWDYLGEAGIGTVRYKSFKNPGQDAPIISAGCGVIDICGKLRPEVQWNRLIWGLDHTPGIGVEPYGVTQTQWQAGTGPAVKAKKPRSRSTLTAKRRNSLSTGIPMAGKRRRNTRLSLSALSMSPVPSPQSATMAREKNRAGLP